MRVKIKLGTKAKTADTMRARIAILVEDPMESHHQKQFDD
jgi:hypothetical protein